MNRIALFDIDGTLIKGFFTMDFFIYLQEKIWPRKKVDDKSPQEILNDYLNKRTNYTQFCQDYADSLRKYFAGEKRDIVIEAAEKFFKEKENDFYGYARPLISLMVDYDIHSFALSGAPQELLEVIADQWGFIEVFGTKIEIKNGIFTDKVLTNGALDEYKELAVKTIITRHLPDLKNSFAFGDTVHDLPALEIVGYPIALNPSDELMRICNERDWRYFFDKDNFLDKIIEII